MKSIFIGTASTAAIALLSWATLSTNRIARAADPVENLLKNASMDEASKDDPHLPANWEKGDDIEGVKYFWNASRPEGEKITAGHLEIAKTAKRYFPIAAWEQTFDRTSDAPAIKVTVKVRAVKVTKAIVDAVFLDSNDEPLSHKWIIYIGPKKDGGAPFNHDWKQYSGTVAIPADCKKIKISLQDYGPGIVKFDDITANYEKDASKVKDALSADATDDDAAGQASLIEPSLNIPADNANQLANSTQVDAGFNQLSNQVAEGGAQTKNLLKNSSINDPFSPTIWTESNAIDGVEYSLDSRAGQNGLPDGSLKIKKTANRYFPIAAWEQTIENTPGMPAITVSAKVKAVKVTKAVIDAIFLDEHGDPMEHKWAAYIGQRKSGSQPLDHDWKEYSGTVAIPPGCNKITISLQDYGPGTVLFDDITAVFENDATKVKEALSTDAASGQASAQEPPSVASTNHWSAQVPSNGNPALTNRIAEPIQTNNPALTGSLSQVQNEPFPQFGTPITSAAPQSAQYPTYSGSFSVPQSRTPYSQNQVFTQQQVYQEAARSQSPNSFGSSQQPSFGQQSFNSVGNPAAFGVPSTSFNAPPGAKLEIDQVIAHIVPATQERFVNGQRVATTNFETVYRTSDSRQFSNKEAATMHASTLKITKQYHDEADPTARVQMREDLVAAVTTEYEQMRSERLKEIEELTKKLEEIKANLDKRDAVKDKIIEKRVEQLLGVDQLYQWDTNPQRPASATQSSHITNYQQSGPPITQGTSNTPFNAANPALGR